MDDGHAKSFIAWGEELLLTYPAGLGAKPDFERNAEARLIWFSQGFSVGVKCASEIGIGGKVFLDKVYDDPKTLDDAGKAAFAERAFNLGGLFLAIAKREADKRADLDATERAAIAAVDSDVERLRSEIAKIGSRENLRFRIEEAKAASAAAHARGDAIADYALARKINALQTRLIEIEGKESRLAFNGFVVTVIGTVTGIVGVILGYYLAK